MTLLFDNLGILQDKTLRILGNQSSLYGCRESRSDVAMEPTDSR